MPIPRSGWLAVGALAAALAGSMPRSICLAVDAALVVALGLCASTRPGIGTPWRRTRVPALAALVGVLAIGLRVALQSGGPDLAGLPEGSARWTGIVESIGSPREGSIPLTVQLDVGDVRITATVPRYPIVQPGDRVALTGTLAPPGDDSYGAFLRSHGLAGSLYSRTLEKLVAREDATRQLETLRRASGDALGRALPEPLAGLAAGILIGLRDRVDRDLATAFTTAGVSHVVAISGWNIAIVGACVGALLRSWPRRRRMVVTLLAIALYTTFSGASASVLRAAAMAAVVLSARESGRAGSAAAALGWAAALLLLGDPALVLDPGFELSSAATLGLIAWGSPLTGWLRKASGSRIPMAVCELLGVSLAAQAATLPIVLAIFGRLSLVSPLANLLVVPLVAPAMAAGLLALGAGWLALLGLPGLIASVVGLPAWLLLSVTVAIVRWSAALPFASVVLPPPANLAVAALVLGLLLSVASGRLHLPHGHQRAATLPAKAPSGPRVVLRGPERAVVLGLIVAIVGLGVVVVQLPDGRVHVTVLDVGQGDAILVEGDRGGRMLVDGGPDPDRLLVALDGELPPWDRRIDLLLLSHPHEDHVAGLPALLQRYRIGRVAEPGMTGPGPGYRAWTEALAARDVATGRLSTGDSFKLDDVDFQVLWPDPGSVPRAPPNTGTGINNVSIVLLGAFGRERFLLAGDIEEGIDPILLARGLPRVDLLKVAHHGSRTSSTDPFLDAVRPSVAVVSVGARNPYGHPATATLQRLTGRGAHVFRTDRDGSVAVALDSSHLFARPEGARRADAVSPAPSGTASLARAAVLSCGIPAGPGLLVASNPLDPGPARTTRLGVYHRADGRSWARRGRPTAPVPRPSAMAVAALAGGRGSGRVARPAHRRARHRRPASPRGIGCVAARPGQGDPTQRRSPGAAARRRVGGLAQRARLSRACQTCREPPRHQAR